jgi:hypothetical protein
MLCMDDNSFSSSLKNEDAEYMITEEIKRRNTYKTEYFEQ